jgi:hypothetical protein
LSTFLTPNALLQKPATADRNWDIPLNANADYLDGVSAIGQLVVTTQELPSASLNVRVTAGTYVKADGTCGTFSGATNYLLSPASVVCLWLTDGGVLSSSSSFPTSAQVRLAQVVTATSTVQSITDARVNVRTAGTGLGFVLKSGDTVSGSFTVASPQTGLSALSINPNGGMIGFFGAAPATAAAAVVAITDNTTGAVSNTLVDVGSSFSQATIDGNFATLAAKVNALIAALKRHGLMST